MKAPRYAHWLVVPALAIGMGIGPVASAAPSGEPDEVTVAEGEPATEGEPGDAAEPEGEPATEGEPTTTEGEPTEPDEVTAAEGEPTTTEGEPTTMEGEPAPEPTPKITVRPQPISASSSKAVATAEVPSNEVVEDPRRRRSDERILFRAGLLSLGVAGAALVPTVVGFQQAAAAHRVLERLDTPSEADARSEVETYERSMNRMAMVAGVITVGSALAGAVLVGIGAPRILRRAESPTVAPAVGPTGAGVVLRGRF